MAGESRTNPTSLPPTPDGWREMQIEELCERVTSGGTPSRQRPEFYENGVFSWFKTKELKDCALYDSEERITQDALDSSSAKLFPPNTVLMAMYGDGITITSLGILRREAATNQACCAMIPKGTVCEPRFLFYSLLSHREDFIRIASGGAQRNLSGSLIRRFALNAPPIPEQKAIAHILGTLDDKIELNQRMNATLEAMARALFQSWFVDFEPVRAKLDGRKPAGLDADTATLFPAHFQESTLGHIPQGWEVCPLADKIELLSGGTPKTGEPEYWGGDIPWFSVKDAPTETDVWVIHTEKSVTELGISNSAAQVFPEKTTIITARGTVGKLALTGTSMAMNQSCYGVRGTTGYGDYFTYYSLRAATAQLQQRTHGTVFDTITRQTFETLDCIFPPPKLTAAFDLAVEPLLEQIRANLHQSRTLAILRDALLPKLLSGELRVANTVAQFDGVVS